METSPVQFYPIIESIKPTNLIGQNSFQVQYLMNRGKFISKICGTFSSTTCAIKFEYCHTSIQLVFQTKPVSVIDSACSNINFLHSLLPSLKLFDILLWDLVTGDNQFASIVCRNSYEVSYWFRPLSNKISIFRNRVSRNSIAMRLLWPSALIE